MLSWVVAKDGFLIFDCGRVSLFKKDGARILARQTLTSKQMFNKWYFHNMSPSMMGNQPTDINQRKQGTEAWLTHFNKKKYEKMRLTPTVWMAWVVSHPLLHLG